MRLETMKFYCPHASENHLTHERRSRTKSSLCPLQITIIFCYPLPSHGLPPLICTVYGVSQFPRLSLAGGGLLPHTKGALESCLGSSKCQSSMWQKVTWGLSICTGIFSHLWSPSSTYKLSSCLTESSMPHRVHTPCLFYGFLRKPYFATCWSGTEVLVDIIN